MITIEIPGYKTVEGEYLLLDYNGTIARDGRVPEEIKEKIRLLGEQMKIFVLTADTHGNAAENLAGLPVTLKTFPKGSALEAKKDILFSLGKDRCIALGNGRNDTEMVKNAALSIGVIDREGAAGNLLLSADMVVRDMTEAFEALLHPLRIVATLRG